MIKNYIYFLKVMPGEDHSIPPIKMLFESSQAAFNYGVNHIDKHSTLMWKDYEDLIYISKVDPIKCPRYLEMFKESDEYQWNEKVKIMKYY